MTSEYGRSLQRAKHKLLGALKGTAKKITYSTQKYDSGGGGTMLYMTVWLERNSPALEPELIRSTVFDQFWLDDVRPRCMHNGFTLNVIRRDHNGEIVRDLKQSSWQWDDYA